MNIPTPADVFAAFFAGGHQAEHGEVTFGPCDRLEDGPADPWAEANYGPSAGPLPPDLAASMAEWAAAQSAAADEPVPYTLTDQAEAALDAGQPEPEAEL